MRDPNRCWLLVNKVAMLWTTVCPDWRFSQLMSNFVLWLGKDPFYIEDDEFIKKFTKYCRHICPEDKRKTFDAMFGEDIDETD